MRATFLILSGSRRGQSEAFDRDALVMGTDPDCDLRFDPHRDPAVAPRHVEIRFENCQFQLRHAGGAAGTFVNNVQVAEVILQDGDLVELGPDGPKVRFHVSPEDQAACKSFRVLVSDAMALARRASRVPMISATAFVGHLVRAVVREASLQTKVVAVLLLALAGAFVGGVPVLLLRAHQAQVGSAHEVAALSARLAGEQQVVEALRREVAAARERGREFQDETAATIATLTQARRRLEAEAAAAAEKVRALEEEREVGSRLIARYGDGVGLLVGRLEWADAAGRPLRYLGLASPRQPLAGPDDRPLLTLEGDGPVMQIAFTGTVFLVRADGLLLTNRHVVEPWLGDPELKRLVDAGLHPRVTDLRVFFPTRRHALAVEVRGASDDADVALLGLREGPRGLPVLPLAGEDTAGRPGEPVLLLGYPTGLQALLAKAPPEAAREILAAGPPDLHRVAAGLAARGLIRPSATRGHLGDVLPHGLVFDAQTAVGGSGGPLFAAAGHVIGINEAILRGFGGSNFAVPVRFGAALIPDGSPIRRSIVTRGSRRGEGDGQPERTRRLSPSGLDLGVPRGEVR